MLRLFALLLLLLLSGCNSPSVPEKKFPVLLPNAEDSLQAYSSADKPTVQAPLFYIGKFRDTIDSRKQYSLDTLWGPADIQGCIVNFTGVERHIVKFPEEWWTKKAMVSIETDTVQRFFWTYNFETDTLFGTRPCVFQPVVVTNTGKDSIFLSLLQLEIEAQTSKKQWRPVTDYYRLRCGNDLQIYGVAPGEIILTAVPSFVGNASTIFRIHWKHNQQDFYSQEYRGTINPKLLGE